MRIIDGFKLRSIGGEQVVMAESAELVNFNRMLVMNASAAYLWTQVEGRDFTVDTLAHLLVEHYAIDATRAHEDAVKVAQAWLDAKVTEE